MFLLGISVAHYLTGPHIELYAFFLPPTLLVTWYVGPRIGALTALLSVFDWVALDVLMGPEQGVTATALLNEMVRLSVFMLVVAVVGQLRRALDREAALARADVLTQLPNRRAFFELAESELERARRYHRPLTSIMMDLDNFKLVNDQMGHQQGDDLLRRVADILRRVTRSSDVVGRLGGDEFALLLPETSEEAGHVFAQKLRRELLAAMQQAKWPVTFSFGVATFHEMPTNVDALLNHADQLMYAVKEHGKNEIKCAVVDTATLKHHLDRPLI